MSTIKAIETAYAGCLFRSRTEARWALFFDTLGIEWQYEKDGYNLGNGIKYLPDFFIPIWDRFFEVKGQEPTPDEIHKAQLLANLTQKRVYLTWGEVRPGKHFTSELWPDCYTDLEELRADAFHSFASCRRCNGIWYLRYGADEFLQEWGELEPYTCDAEKFAYPEPGGTDRVSIAYRAASSARFEFGETPTPPRKG